jgi:hypothetical protein
MARSGALLTNVGNRIGDRLAAEKLFHHADAFGINAQSDQINALSAQARGQSFQFRHLFRCDHDRWRISVHRRRNGPDPARLRH